MQEKLRYFCNKNHDFFGINRSAKRILDKKERGGIG